LDLRNIGSQAPETSQLRPTNSATSVDPEESLKRIRKLSVESADLNQLNRPTILVLSKGEA